MKITRFDCTYKYINYYATIRPTIYVNTYNISGVSSIPEGIAAKFIIAGLNYYATY
jgi:hypothetical protein